MGILGWAQVLRLLDLAPVSCTGRYTPVMLWQQRARTTLQPRITTLPDEHGLAPACPGTSAGALSRQAFTVPRPRLALQGPSPSTVMAIRIPSSSSRAGAHTTPPRGH